MTAFSDIAFAPQLPWWLIVLAGGALALTMGLGAWRRAAGVGWRSLAAATGLLALANPSLVMASYISRANAAVIDLRSLLEQG